MSHLAFYGQAASVYSPHVANHQLIYGYPLHGPDLLTPTNHLHNHGVVDYFNQQYLLQQQERLPTAPRENIYPVSCLPSPSPSSSSLSDEEESLSLDAFDKHRQGSEEVVFFDDGPRWVGRSKRPNRQRSHRPETLKNSAIDPQYKHGKCVRKTFVQGDSFPNPISVFSLNGGGGGAFRHQHFGVSVAPAEIILLLFILL